MTRVTLEPAPDNCPDCGTKMAETGAPIWDVYCPNKACGREKRLMREGVARVIGQRERAEYERLKAKFDPTPD